MKINKEKERSLQRELKEYEKVTPMTEEERIALHEWVRDGNSIHENGSMVCCEGGRPVDFLDVYREEAELRRKLSSMTEEERKRYLYMEYGIENEPPKKLTYEELQERSRRLYRTCMLYWEVLVRNGLGEEADEHLRLHIGKEMPFEDPASW